MPTVSLQGNSSSSSRNSLERSNVIIYVGETTFDYWMDFDVSSHMLDATDGFQFHAPVVKGLNDAKTLTSHGLVEGAICTIWAVGKTGKATQQHLGRIGRVIHETDRKNGSIITVTGRDHMGPIVDSDSLPSIAMENTSLADVIYAALQPYKYSKKQILIDNDANRDLLTGKPISGVKLSADAPTSLATMKIDQARPHAGETTHAFLMRHCRRFGLIMWGTARGEICFGRPNYDQKPLYDVHINEFSNQEKNTALHIMRTRNIDHMPSEVHVFGKSHGHDWARTDVHAVVEDEYTKKLGYYRVLTVSDHNCKTKEEAAQRGKYELSHRRQGVDGLHARMQDVQQNDAVFAIDTIANVNYDVGGIVDEPWYVVGRRFVRTRGGGTTTELTIVPKNSIALGDVPFAGRDLSEASYAAAKTNTEKIPNVPADPTDADPIESE